MMDPTVTDLPSNEFDWITEETHKMVFTVSVMPGNMNQKGGDLTEMDLKLYTHGTMDQKAIFQFKKKGNNFSYKHNP